jgi:hypothetical protein
LARIFLVDLDTSTVDAHAAQLRQAGHEVECRTGAYTPAWLQALDRQQPETVVISLDRLPSHGRGIASAISARKVTRTTPLIFAGGETEKVAATRAMFPEAIYASWSKLAAAVNKALRQKSQTHPSFTIATDRPLVRKLGIKPGFRVATFNVPGSFERTLGPLPDGAVLEEDAAGEADMTILFCARESDLMEGYPRAARSARVSRRLWVAWPKKSSGVRTDLTMDAVRTFLLARGWVDYKVCAIDSTWTASLSSNKGQAR